jgi:hypothetical protein
MELFVNALLMFLIAERFFVHVKQCANRAYTTGLLSIGNSSLADKLYPALFLKFTFIVLI